MRPLYVHCGPHKTGSTSLQHAMEAAPGVFARRGLLASSLDPTGRMSLGRAHQEFVRELPALVAGDRRRARFWNRLRVAARDSGLIPIVSCEILSTHLLRPGTLDALVAYCASIGYRPHFLYVLRDLPGWWNSNYVQDTKKFYTALGFEDWVAAAQGNPRYDPSRLLAPLLGRDDLDLTVLSFPRIVREGLVSSLLGAMGGAPLGPEEGGADAAANPNAGTRAVHLGRRIAARMAEAGLNARRQRHIYPYLKRHAEARGWAAEPFQGFDDASARALRDRFAASNEALAQRLWGRPWAEMVPPQTGLARRVFDPATASRAELDDLAAIEAELEGWVALTALMVEAAA